ncbi:MAG: lysoplasmalogenase family protein [Clostridia bacterium]
MFKVYLFIAICGAFALGTALAYTNNRKYIAPACKLAASLSFMVIAMMAIYMSNNFNSYGVFLLCALGCGFLGDIMLMVKEFFHDEKSSGFFLSLGVIFFSFGHILYIIRFVILTPSFNFWLLLLALLLPLSLFAAKGLKLIKFNRYTPLMFVYSAILSVTAVVTLNLLITNPNTFSEMVFSASLLFVISDSVLCIHYFGDEKYHRSTNYFIMIFYYAAQVLYALSIAFV